MIDPIEAVQKYLYTTLSAASAITEIVGTKIYDAPVDDAVAPYLAIGDYTAIDAGDKTGHAEELTWTIHGFTEGESKLSAVRLNAAVKEVLHDIDSVSIGSGSHRIVNCRWEYGDVIRDGDRGFHAISRFRIYCEALS